MQRNEDNDIWKQRMHTLQLQAFEEISKPYKALLFPRLAEPDLCRGLTAGFVAQEAGQTNQMYSVLFRCRRFIFCCPHMQALSWKGEIYLHFHNDPRQEGILLAYPWNKRDLCSSSTWLIRTISLEKWLSFEYGILSMEMSLGLAIKLPILLEYHGNEFHSYAAPCTCFCQSNLQPGSWVIAYHFDTMRMHHPNEFLISGTHAEEILRIISCTIVYMLILLQLHGVTDGEIMVDEFCCMIIVGSPEKHGSWGFFSKTYFRVKNA